MREIGALYLFGGLAPLVCFHVFWGFQNRTLIFAIQEICWEGEYQLNEKMQLVALTFNP
jgi:hypothetical protein